ncbi:MAG: glutathione S-transferase N-terminal domain-containing protein [Gammaproteobacteria bacterium]|nr:glutathione S-transferase N-terminal domain-containing protein [Gammaproteobacteria bacterium]
MRLLIRYFFKTVRLVLTPVVLLAHWIATPKGVERSKEAQKKVDEQTSQLALYHFKTCPFCLKVRREMSRLSLDIELRDAQHDMAHREDLMVDGGELKVPCLQIKKDNGNVEWMYESNDIIDYLHGRFAAPQA